MKFLLEVTS